MNRITGFGFSRFKGMKDVYLSVGGDDGYAVLGKGFEGKTTCLEFLGFLGACFRKEIGLYLLESFPGTFSGLIVPDRAHMLIFADINDVEVSWEGVFEPRRFDIGEAFGTSTETLEVDGKTVVDVSWESGATVLGKSIFTPGKWSGALAPGLDFKKLIDDDWLRDTVTKFSKFVKSVSFSGTIDPLLVRGNDHKKSPWNIGVGGGDAMPLFAGLSKDAKARVNEELLELFPDVKSLSTRRICGELECHVKDRNGRPIALEWLPSSYWKAFAALVQMEGKATVCLFDDMEAMPQLCDTLRTKAATSEKQVFVAGRTENTNCEPVSAASCDANASSFKR